MRLMNALSKAGKRQRLENCLASFIAGLRAAAEGVKTLRLKREQWKREWQEKERRRLEQQERQRREEEKIKDLEKWVANWNQSNKIRQFLAAVERALAEAKQKQAETPDLSEWLSWARGYADSIDPIHLTFYSSPQTDNNNDS
jgi:hypothetical protein